MDFSTVRQATVRQIDKSNRRTIEFALRGTPLRPCQRQDCEKHFRLLDFPTSDNSTNRKVEQSNNRKVEQSKSRTVEQSILHYTVPLCVPAYGRIARNILDFSTSRQATIRQIEKSNNRTIEKSNNRKVEPSNNRFCITPYPFASLPAAGLRETNF